MKSLQLILKNNQDLQIKASGLTTCEPEANRVVLILINVACRDVN